MKQVLNRYDTLTQSSNLTRSQLLFWTGQQLNPEAPLYNMALAFDLAGTIDPAHFQTAFQELINRSDALRTVFHVFNGIPTQKVLPEMPYRVEVLDWSNNPEAISGFQTWARERSQLIFDASIRLFDCVLLKFGTDRYIWYLNQHHLMTDAWAVSVLYRTMARLYQNALTGNSPETISLPAFQHYLEYEKAASTDPRKEDAKAYWGKKLTLLPEPPELYGYKEQQATSRSERVFVDLGTDRSDRLRALAQEADVRSWTQHLSLFNIFATSLFAYLYRVSGQRKLAIGCPAHNRPTADFKETPGLFIEIFPMLTELAEEDSFNSLLQRVRVESNEFLRYAQPGAGAPELSRSFNVVLNYIHAAFDDFAGIPTRSEWIHPGHCDPRHHLRLQVHDFDTSGSIQLHFDLNCRAFDQAMRKSVPQHFIHLLDAFIADRNQALGKPPLLTGSEYGELVMDFNKTQTHFSKNKTILALFEAQVATTPTAPAIRCKDQTIDYATVNEKANQLARYLRQQKVGPGHRVALYLKRSPELIISILAVWKSGAAYVPIPTDYPTERVSFMLDDAQVSLLITQEELLRVLPHAEVPVIRLDTDWEHIEKNAAADPQLSAMPENLAYIMYTSGSTGQPKGVMISHRALANYIQWAGSYYVLPPQPAVPLFTSIGFDLTVTSLFLPLVLGGHAVIYEESEAGPDLALLQVIEDNAVDLIKLTPSHLALLKKKDLTGSRLQTMIVGGEDFKWDLAKATWEAFGKQLIIYNEYGPTEATVGCIVHQFDADDRSSVSVPIGKPISNMEAYILDSFGNAVPRGTSGELYVAGTGLADGYWNRPALTREKFVDHPFRKESLLYRTGDLARWNPLGQLEYLGRTDHQIKIGGIRIELGEIEAALATHPKVQDCVVALHTHKGHTSNQQEKNCVKCGLTSHYPHVEFDEEGVCSLCRSFETYEQKAQRYFKTMDDLRAVFDQARSTQKGKYDCLALLSGGKDSTYVLAQLVEMGLEVLAFTLDNGYISEGAKENIRKVVSALGVDHVFGETPAMNDIFVDSLHRHHNVCDGCFKTIYTLSTQIALEKEIPFIVTGLSRGQFFETRLTEELFRKEQVDIDGIDRTILDARKAYHRVDDAVYRLLDVSMFEEDTVFEKVQFVDFYRYCDVSLDEMLDYLKRRLPWVRPSDTGRSTNCLINKAGIYIHKKEKGYSNYAFPYSWDVRVGHKKRDAALEEINEDIEAQEVQQILREIGYQEDLQDLGQEQRLVAYYVAALDIPTPDFREQLLTSLPHYMIPFHFVRLESLPLTPNGKVDRQALPASEAARPATTGNYEAPRTEIEALLAGLWSEILHLDRIGIHDNFLELGGYSLAAIRLMARINEAFELQLQVNRIFEFPTIAALAGYMEETIGALLEEMEKGGF